MAPLRVLIHYNKLLTIITIFVLHCKKNPHLTEYLLISPKSIFLNLRNFKVVDYFNLSTCFNFFRNNVQFQNKRSLQ